MYTNRKTFYRRHLPHWDPGGMTLFVTFRLAGSLPKTIMETLHKRRQIQQLALEKIQNPQLRKKRASLVERQHFGRWDDVLDQATSGPRWLAQPQVASIVTEALHYRHDRMYDLGAFCIMPNHVHVTFRPLKKATGEYNQLSKIMQSLKGYTARRANQLLGRTGAFWQDESYDHVVRDAQEYERVVAYILNNPVKAELVSHWEDWPWTFCRVT